MSIYKDFYEENFNKVNKYKSALEEIKEMVSRHYPGRPRDVLDIINEVLNDSRE